LLFQWQPLRKGHNVFYCAVGDKVFNLVNPNLYADFIADAPPNKNNWDTTIKIYNRDKHNGRIGDKFYRARVNPDRLFYRDLYELSVLPSFFLLALFICTPILSWKKKGIYFILSLFILYTFLSFHYSHIFENIVMNDNNVGDNLWAKFVSIFGFRGLTEPLYIISIVTWAIFTFRPSLWEWLVGSEDESNV
jgi:hypothetical protein